MPTTTTLNEQIDTVESAGWLILDVVDLLRQNTTYNHAEKALQSNLRAKVAKALRRQERDGDPLNIVEMMQELLEDG